MSIECPKCGESLADYGTVIEVGYVNGSRDPEGKARVDLILECENCEGRWNAFLALEDFFLNPIAPGA